MSSPTIDRRLGLVGNIALKAPATVVATSNIALSGQQTIDGVAVLATNAAGVADRVLCVGQTNAVENGIWDVSTGTWSRSLDANGNYDLGQGTMVLIARGSTYTGTVWKLTTAAPITIGTTSLTWSRSLTSDMSSLSFQQIGTAAAVRSALAKMQDFICILDFIPESEHAAIKAGTSTYDCSTALTNAIASRTVVGLAITVLTGGPQIYFPAGKYNFTTTRHLKIACHLKGERAGMAGGWSTHFVFPQGVPGFVVHKENTDSTGTVAATTGADGSVFEDILFYGTNRAGFPNAHGIWLRARAAIIRCTFQAFGGNGIHILATAGGGGFIEGNANSFYIENSYSVANGGHGLFVDGADVNAGTISMLDCSINLGWGVYDSSFLGNTYVGCHVTDNVTGSYKSDSANARNLFLGCYSEGGWPASDILAPAMVIGGLHGAGFTVGTTALIMDVDAGGGFIKNGLQMPTASVGYGQAATSGTGITFRDTGGVSFWTFEKAVGRWGWRWANLGTPGFLNFFDQTATTGNGYPRSLAGVNGALGIGTHYLGSTAQMLLRDLSSGPPTSTSVVSLQGDFIWNTAGTSGQPIGWYCTVAGSPGTWRAAGTITTST